VKRVFYSKKQKILFFINEKSNITANVCETAKALIAGAEKLAGLALVHKEAVNFFIPSSGDYKNKNIFFVKTDTIPGCARVLEKKTMGEWIEI